MFCLLAGSVLCDCEAPLGFMGNPHSHVMDDLWPFFFFLVRIRLEYGWGNHFLEKSIVADVDANLIIY